MHSNVSRLLKESWALVEEQQDRVAGYFYARIFLSFPQLRDMFPVQMDTQRARLLGAIVQAVQTFDEPDRVDEYLRALGRDHRKFSVEPEHYAMIKFALVAALREYAGDRWNLQYEQAWSDVYDLIAAKMIAGAREQDDEPPFRYAEVLTHERRGSDVAVFTCRPLQSLRFRAADLRQHRDALPAATVADVLDGERAARTAHWNSTSRRSVPDGYPARSSAV